VYDDRHYTHALRKSDFNRRTLNKGAGGEEKVGRRVSSEKNREGSELSAVQKGLKWESVRPDKEITYKKGSLGKDEREIRATELLPPRRGGGAEKEKG